MRHHKRSGQLSYSQSGRVASHKRSVLLSGFVVFVLGSVISREVWPFAGIHRFERWSKPRTKGLAICRQEGGGRAREKRSVLLSRFVVFVAGSVRSPKVWPFVGIRRGLRPRTKGLAICRQEVCPTVARWSVLPREMVTAKRSVSLSAGLFIRRPQGSHEKVCPFVHFSEASHKRSVLLSTSPLREGLSFSLDPSFWSRVGCSHKRSV